MQHLVSAFQQPFSQIKLKSLTDKEIYEMNKSLKWKTCYGYDEVPLWIGKLCYIHLTHLIAVLYLQVLLAIHAFPLDRY